MDRRIDIVLSLMKDNDQEELSLEMLAGAVNLSVSRLSHLFKAETGMSVAQHFKSLKMKKAKELIEMSFLNMKQIMTRIGMKDKSHFTRDFKKSYGLTPTQYRARFLKVSPTVGGSKIR